MVSLRYFSSDYHTARRRFRLAVAESDALLEHHRLVPEQCPEEDLSIDVAFIGSDTPDWTLVVSSGLHGVEGFFGSAVQLALLTQIGSGRILADNGRIVLVHAINPYGFHFLRRVNEENVDLNRNFLCEEQKYQGRPDGYDKLFDFLNPQSAPTMFDPYWLKGAALWLRVGMPALKACIVTGQYDFSKGVFYGGQKASLSTCVVQTNYKRWLGGASRAVHADFHTGLGKFGTYKLLLPAGTSDLNWYRTWFGDECVEETVDENGTAYRSTGTMGQWLNRHFKDLNFRFFNAEFGTYSAMRTLGALRAENRAHFFSPLQSRVHARAKARIKRLFCPNSKSWRQAALRRALDLIDRSIEALCSDNNFPDMGYERRSIG
jgi:hypothetical protein